MRIFNILKPNPLVVGMSATGIGCGLLYTTYRKRYSAPPRNAKYWREKWKKDKNPGWDPGEPCRAAKYWLHAQLAQYKPEWSIPLKCAANA